MIWAKDSMERDNDKGSHFRSVKTRTQWRWSHRIVHVRLLRAQPHLVGSQAISSNNTPTSVFG